MQLQYRRCCRWRHFHANAFESTFCMQTPAFKVEWRVIGVRCSYAIKPLCPNDSRLWWLWWGILAAKLSRSEFRVLARVPCVDLACQTGRAHAELQENWELFLSLIYLSQIAQQVRVCSPARAPGSWSRCPPASSSWDPRCRCLWHSPTAALQTQLSLVMYWRSFFVHVTEIKSKPGLEKSNLGKNWRFKRSIALQTVILVSSFCF